MRGERWMALWLWATTAAACQTGQLIEPYNELPVADSKVLKDGVPVEQARDGSIADLVFPFAGMPVAITLDGTSSHDPDGKIAGYRWLSGTRIPDASLPPPWTPDAGTPMPFLRRPPPEGPLTEASPTLTLDAGLWAFSLWVVDDQGAWSSPDTIRFFVGDPPPPPRDAGTAGDAGAQQEAGVATDAATSMDGATDLDGATGVDAAATDATSTADGGPEPAT